MRSFLAHHVRGRLYLHIVRAYTQTIEGTYVRTSISSLARRSPGGPFFISSVRN